MASLPPFARRAAMAWLPAAAGLTVLAGTLYAGLQFTLRSGANDPQIQMAHDAAAGLDGGDAPGAVLPTSRVEMKTSLAPFVLVFDRSGTLVASSATLDGVAPPYPLDVLRGIGSHGERRVTWQPEPGVREASVAVPWQGGYVVAGRSLRLSEERTGQILLLAFAGWFASLVAAAVIAILAAWAFPVGPAGIAAVPLTRMLGSG